MYIHGCVYITCMYMCLFWYVEMQLRLSCLLYADCVYVSLAFTEGGGGDWVRLVSGCWWYLISFSF